MRLRTLRLIVASEYGRRMKERGFIVSSFLLPVLVLVAIVVAGYLAASEEKASPSLAYVDRSGVLAEPRQLEGEGEPEFLPLADEAAAREAVLSGEVGAAFIIAPDYATSRAVTTFSRSDLPRQARESFLRFMRWNLVRDLSPMAGDRASEGFDLIVRSLDGRREFSDSTWPNIIIPFVAAILFFIIIIGNASNALRAVVDEKESRTMEVLVTSVSPDELMGGKILAIFAIGMTQLAIWAVVVAIAVTIARQSVAELATFRFDWSFLLLVIGAFMPAYVLVASLLAAVGSIASELRESQQLATMVTLPTFAPTWFTTLIMSSPNGPVSVALSLFPLTSPLTLSMRWAFSSPPVWQLAVSLAILWASAAAAVWLAARVFRAGMLRYGKRLSWHEVRLAVQGRGLQ